MSWTWIKAIDPAVISDPNRSYPLEALDSLQSAYPPSQDQGSLGASATPANQQPVVEFYSDSLEPGEVLVEGLQPTSNVAVSASRPPGGVASAHNVYNSYAVNPWNRYKLAAAGSKAFEAIFDREQILRTELVHLRGSLSEKTKEVEQLSRELDVAHELIGKLQQQDNPPSHPASNPEDAIGTLPLMDQSDRSLVIHEPSGERGCLLPETNRNPAVCSDAEGREITEAARKNVESGEPVHGRQDLKQDRSPEMDMKLSATEWLTTKLPHRINNLHSTKVINVGRGSLEPDGSVAAESSSAEEQMEHPELTPSCHAPLGKPVAFSASGGGHQILAAVEQRCNQPATDDMEITPEQPIVPEQQNVVVLHFESHMQQEEQRRNQELETASVAADGQEVVSKETAASSASGEDFKDPSYSVKAEMLSELKETVQP